MGSPADLIPDRYFNLLIDRLEAALEAEVLPFETYATVLGILFPTRFASRAGAPAPDALTLPGTPARAESMRRRERARVDLWCGADRRWTDRDGITVIEAAMPTAREAEGDLPWDVSFEDGRSYRVMARTRSDALVKCRSLGYRVRNGRVRIVPASGAKGPDRTA